ncbi:uncharacterized protein LOC128545959 [Mercenaria mercenaria]|uniref:uncharacterized protein LOC128545959 n=1 Tax=Mercenaria mercenaria TaxID=6596 RepID=UPI00234F98DF|nr:uncharacterized protein LOC128545959 [Mercenaria mercenaria]
MDLKAVFTCFLAVLAVKVTSASLYDPHMFPDKGPFFEGWYMRVSDLYSRDSFGLLFGSVLPSSSGNITAPLVVASVLLRSCDKTIDTCKLVSSDGKFTLNDLNITVKGQPVQSDPDKTAPPDFKWQVNSGSQGGYFEQKGGITTFNFRLGDLILRGKATNPSYWNDQGTGPEGWLINLPLPLHWFVYSLRSELSSCEIQNVTSGAVTKVYTGAVHLEKNWGNSFPRQWIWSEGVSFDNDNATFAMSGGLVDFPFLSVNAYLIGYRNPMKKLSLDFRPVDSLISTQIDGCTGNVSVSVYSLRYKLDINLVAPVATLSSCLLGPEMHGFVRACVESYDATATIQIYERNLLLFGYKLIEQKKFEKIALEFGGMHVCGGKCSNSMPPEEL